MPTKPLRDALMSRYPRLNIEGRAFFYTVALADCGGNGPNYPDAPVNERVGTALRAFAHPTLASARTCRSARAAIASTATSSGSTSTASPRRRMRRSSWRVSAARNSIRRREGRGGIGCSGKNKTGPNERVGAARNLSAGRALRGPVGAFARPAHATKCAEQIDNLVVCCQENPDLIKLR